jgi:AGCS family alanine or glycine:cation symporter
VLTIAVGLVIVGGIKRIGDVASRIVPFMCVLYLLAGVVVIAINIADVPATFALIFSEAFSPSEGSGAFIGGAAGYGFLKGMQRALFSSEAGQGTAPMAHSAARTDEPVREGTVAGLEPFIDTLVVCTLTGLVILLSGAWNRAPTLSLESAMNILPVTTNGDVVMTGDGLEQWEIRPVRVAVAEAIDAAAQMREGAVIFAVIEGHGNAETGGTRHRVYGELQGSEAVGWTAEFDFFEVPPGTEPVLAADGVYLDLKGATLTAKSFDRAIPNLSLGVWIVPITVWLFAFSTIISWSYYGEQGIIFLFGQRYVMPYRVVYCALILVSVQLIRTQDELDMVSAFGTGMMLWANIPIMLIFGPMAMRAHKDYFRRLDAGEMAPEKGL